MKTNFTLYFIPKINTYNLLSDLFRDLKDIL